MQLSAGETTLVIAGAWNPAVVTPEWLLRYGLEQAAGAPAARIGALIPAGIGLVVDMPRYTIEDMTFSVRPDALVLQVAECTEEAFDRLERVAANILQNLSHTPVGGLGCNFDFKEDGPPPDSLATFTAANLPLTDEVPDTWSVRTSAITTSFSRDGGLVNIQRVLQGGVLRVKFNFHFEVATANACHALLSGAPPPRLMWSSFVQAQALVNSLTEE